ncbi:hypothetical protein HMPREF0591_0080 [Mycobacterium parascrofulaceum ATCC BAA-614]|uniref:Uncharacterized protein n=1 Tax=Mycobacterium parascrofulaceum ATCC BAA-614 TaxID=525368 RepID=D5P1N6_9MYCO|nr:hypothetical protein HMPREF0591_0080 [Mycobacterium parascrofulaceum ATCC BAA-614]
MRTDTNFSGNPARVAAAVDGWVLPANTAYFVTVTTRRLSSNDPAITSIAKSRPSYHVLIRRAPITVFASARRSILITASHVARRGTSRYAAAELGFDHAP